MMRLRMLGLALVAAFAMGAVASASASAANGLFEQSLGEYPAVFEAKQVGTQEFFAGKGKITCEDVTFSGTLSKASETLDVTPSFTKCKGLEQEVTVISEHCQYELKAGEQTATVGENKVFGSGHGALINSGGTCKLVTKAIECTIILKAQGPFVGVSLTSSHVVEEKRGVWSDAVEFATKGLTYTAEGGACAMGKIEIGTHSNGEYKGAVTTHNIGVNGNLSEINP
jgi:hypothetical protein